jgi:hypothetical protein
LKIIDIAVVFDVRNSMHHHEIQIIQPTRCNSFTSLLLDVYVWLNTFRASPRPLSGAYNCTRSLWFYRWKEGAGALLVVVWQVCQTTTNNSINTTVFESNYLNSCSLSFNLTLDGVDDQRHSLATLLRLRKPVPILQKVGAWVRLGAGLDKQIISRPLTGVRNLTAQHVPSSYTGVQITSVPSATPNVSFRETGKGNRCRFVAMFLANYGSKSCTSQSCSSATLILFTVNIYE